MALQDFIVNNGLVVNEALQVTGTTTFTDQVITLADLAVNGGDLTTNQTTFNLVNTTATTLNIGGAATTLNIGAIGSTSTIAGALVITGDFTVNGTTTTINSTNKTITDALIELNSGLDVANTNDGGFIIERGTSGDNAAVIWNETADRFVFGTTTATAASTGSIAVTPGIIEASLFGNASTATALETARDITLTGVVTGTVSFDGTATASITTVHNTSPTITLTGAVTGTGTMTNLGNVSFATVAADIPFSSITTTPTTLAGYGITDAATSAQGTLADTAVQPADNITTLTNNAGYLTSATLAAAETDPVVGAINGLVKSNGAGLISAAIAGTDYSIFDGAYSSLTGAPTLATVATSGLFTDLLSRPTTLAGYGITDAATSAQGTLADTALQSGDNVSTLVNDAGYLTTETSHADVVVDGDFLTPGLMTTDGAGVYSITANNATDWDTAFGWGDHTAGGYQLASTALTTSTTFGGDVSGTFDNIVVADNSHLHTIANVTGLQTALDNKVETSLLGAAGGVAQLDGTGRVPANQLPSFVDDVLEAINFASLPETGEIGKLYVTTDNNQVYRWTGSVYIEIATGTGTADTAAALATARNIELQGDVTGTASFDGTADAVITAAIAANSVGIPEINTVDGTNGQVLSTDGAGNLSFITVGGVDTNDFLDSLTFATGTGVLTASVGTQLDVTVNLDGRYLTAETSHADVVVDGDFAVNGLMERTAAGVYTTITNNSANWDTAFGWGDHAAASYLVAADIATVVVDADFAVNGLMERTAAGVYTTITNNSTDWNTAFGWGDHAAASYLVAADIATVIVDGDFITNGLMTRTAPGVYDIVVDASANWNTAFTWGDHSLAGYLTAEVNDLTAAVTWANVPDANITQTSVTQHQAALSITESQISDLQPYLLAADVASTETVTAAVTQITLASFAAATYDGAKYIITARNGTSSHVTEIVVVHNGLDAFGTSYATVTNAGVLATYEVDFNGGNVRLLCTPGQASSTTFKVNQIFV